MTRHNTTLSNEGALPTFPTDSFVGRSEEITRLRRLVAAGRRPLVTLLGPGGVGKTRLALEVLRDADEWSGLPVAIVELAATQREEEIVRAIAQALDIVDHEEHLRGRIVDALRDRPHLVLLDNLEHLIGMARATVRWVLDQAPGTQIIATSRLAVGLAEEAIIELSPLQTSRQQSESDPLELEAVRLFLDRAMGSNPRFVLHDGDAERIATLCAMYDGLPLAIELVASWSDVLSPREMLDRHVAALEDRRAGREERHRSLDDAIRWSYELLDEADRDLFRRLALFPGGFSRDLAEGIARGSQPGEPVPWSAGYDDVWGWWVQDAWGDRPVPYDQHVPDLWNALPALEIDCARTIAALVDHHLVLPAEDIDGVLCFGMLETIRAFGIAELERLGELQGARQAHTLTTMAFAEVSSNYMWSVGEPRWGIERVMAAMPSVRAALHWCAEQGEAGWPLIVRIAGPVWNIWQTRGLVTEGRRWLEFGMGLPPELAWLQAIELPPLAFLCWIQNDDARADEVVDLAQAAMERSGTSFSGGLTNLVRALVLYRHPEPDYLRILHHIELAEAAFTEWNVAHGMVGVRAIYGIVARLLGDMQQALDLFEEAGAIAAEANYAWGSAITRYFAGETLREMAADDESRLPEAIAMMVGALQMTWSQGDAWSAGGALSGLACIRVQRGELVEAATMFGAAATLMQRVGGSLLPADFLTHAEISEQLRSRMGASNYDRYFAIGESEPEAVVEVTIEAFGAAPESEESPVRLTNRQMLIVQDLARGLDPAGIAKRRGRSVSATYEILERISERLGVQTWEEIVPAAVERSLVGRSR
ncbi:MAG: AAA family ATPase [Thermomicrobiales bacterium]|nr:AAA family ATPase [Thermomicrobiales bacterium]